MLSSPGRLLDNTLELPAQLGSAWGSWMTPGVTLQSPGWVWWHRPAAVPWEPRPAAAGRRAGHPAPLGSDLLLLRLN